VRTWFAIEPQPIIGSQVPFVSPALMLQDSLSGQSASEVQLDCGVTGGVMFAGGATGQVVNVNVVLAGL
jgi:hypothetical protein